MPNLFYSISSDAQACQFPVGSCLLSIGRWSYHQFTTSMTISTRSWCYPIFWTEYHVHSYCSSKNGNLHLVAILFFHRAKSDLAMVAKRYTLLFVCILWGVSEVVPIGFQYYRDTTVNILVTLYDVFGHILMK